jgi:hypothetical protein
LVRCPTQLNLTGASCNGVGFVSTNNPSDGWNDDMLLATTTNPASSYPIIATYRQTYVDSQDGPGILEVIICPNSNCATTSVPPPQKRAWATLVGVSAVALLVAMGIVATARLRRSKQRQYEAIDSSAASGSTNPIFM